MFFKLSSRYLNIFGLVYLTIIGIIMLKYIKNKKIKKESKEINRTSKKRQNNK